jgi:hypothetical protein
MTTVKEKASFDHSHRAFFLGAGALLSAFFVFAYFGASDDLKYPIPLGKWVALHHLVGTAMLVVAIWRAKKRCFRFAVDLMLPVLIMLSTAIWWIVDAGGAFGSFASKISTGLVAGFATAAIVPQLLALLSRRSRLR